MRRSLLLTVALIALLAIQVNAYVRVGNHKAGGTRISRHRGLAAASDCATLCESTASCTHASASRRRTETTWTCSLLSAMTRMTGAPRSVVFVMDSAATSRTYQKSDPNTFEIASPFLKRKLRNLDACKDACDLNANCDAVSQRGKYCYFHNTDETPKAMQRYPVWVVVTSGCMNPQATNYNADAVVDDGSCTLPVGMGCGNSHAVNYDSDVTTHNEASCEYPTAGCMDSMATNYNPMVTVDDGSCTLPAGMGCGNMDALNYDSEVVTHNEAMCEFPPEFVLTPYPGKKYLGGVFVRRANGQNSAKCQQLCMRMGDECHGINSVSSKCFVYSTNHHEQGSVVGTSKGIYYAKERVGCTNSTALNFNTAAQAEWDPSTCRFDSLGTLSGGGTSSSSTGSSGSTSSESPSAPFTGGQYYYSGTKPNIGAAATGMIPTATHVPAFDGASKVVVGSVSLYLTNGVLRCKGQCKSNNAIKITGVTSSVATRRLHMFVAPPPNDLNMYDIPIASPTGGDIEDFWAVSGGLFVKIAGDNELYVVGDCQSHWCGHDVYCDANNVTSCGSGTNNWLRTSAISSSFPISGNIQDMKNTNSGPVALIDGALWVSGSFGGTTGGWRKVINNGVARVEGLSGGLAVKMTNGPWKVAGYQIKNHLKPEQDAGIGDQETFIVPDFGKPIKKIGTWGYYSVYVLFTDGTGAYTWMRGMTAKSTWYDVPGSGYVDMHYGRDLAIWRRADGSTACVADYMHTVNSGLTTSAAWNAPPLTSGSCSGPSNLRAVYTPGFGTVFVAV